MSRAFWFVAGAGAGVYAVAKVRRLAESVTPDGLRDRLAGLSAAAHVFGEEVRAGMAEKETELRRRLELRLDGRASAGRPTAAGDDGAGGPAGDDLERRRLDVGRRELTREGTT